MSVTPHAGVAVAVQPASTVKEDIKRCREFYRYLQPDNLLDPRLRRKDSTFSTHIDHTPSLSAALAPYCQLTALRCGAQKAMLNVMDRDVMYFLAEAMGMRSTDPEKQEFREFVEDPIMMSCSTVPLKGRICELTIRLDREESESQVPTFVINDLLESSFAHLPVISGPPYYRFYAGTPITTSDDINIGSLAVMDIEPRPNGLTAAEEEFLGRTAAQIMTYLETNRQAIEGRRSRRLAEGLECFIAGKKSLTEQLPGILSEKTIKRRTKAAYGITLSSDNETDAHDTPQKHYPVSRIRGASLESAGSEVSTSEQSTDNEELRKDTDSDSRSHSKTFSRAANLLREAFGDLGEDGSVVFFNLKGRLDRNHGPQRPPKSLPKDSARDKDSGEYNMIKKSALARILASSSASEPFVYEADQLDMPVNLSEEALRELMRRYPGGRLWSFDDAHLLSSSEEERTPGVSEGPRRSSRRRESEGRKLKAAFPHARQLLFAPVWDSDSGSFAHAVFVSVSLESRSLSAITELPFLNSFCSTVMAECSRLDTVKADKQKSDFVGTISHEMRSPLHGILASVEFLRDTDLTGFQQSLIDTIDSCSRTLEQTLSHVLDHSKINSFQKQWQASNKRTNYLKKKHYLGPENASKPSMYGAPPLLQLFGVTDISAVLEEVVEGLVISQSFSTRLDMTDLSREARGRGESGPEDSKASEDVQVILDVQQADWAFMTQPGAVRRIVLNITGNALKYTSSGSIIVRLELKNKETEDSDSEVMVLTVTDTGCGISEEFLKTRLFVPFAQENALAPGTGLGLSICHGIITMLGGAIDVKSQVGKGTTMQATLPLKRPLPGQVSTGNTPLSGGTTTSQGSNPDESITVLQNHASESRVAFYRPSRLSGDLLADVVSKYVKDWYGLHFVGQELVGSANVVLTEEQDLESLITKVLGTPGNRPVIVILCSVASRHSASYTSELERRINSAVEFVAKPVGPYKLAKSIRLALQKTRTIKPQFPTVTTLGVIPEQITPVTPGEGITHGLHELDLGTGSQSDSAQVVQASETFAASQSSQNAQMAITSPVRGATSPTPRREEASFPFPDQSEREQRPQDDRLTNGTSLQPQPQPISGESVRPMPWKDSIARQTSSEDVVVNPRVLLVDDNKINLRLLETFLRNKRKYTHVDLAEDGQQAVDSFNSAPRGEPYEIIFMDISMPVMNGFEATRAIRGSEEGGSDKTGGAMIIALTGLASGSDQAEGFDSGVDIYLTKPVSFKEVGKLLDNWEAHQRLKEEGATETHGEAPPHGALTGYV